MFDYFGAYFKCSNYVLSKYRPPHLAFSLTFISMIPNGFYVKFSLCSSVESFERVSSNMISESAVPPSLQMWFNCTQTWCRGNCLNARITEMFIRRLWSREHKDWDRFQFQVTRSIYLVPADNSMIERISEQRQRSLPVTRKGIQRKAMQLSADSNFHASDGWMALKRLTRRKRTTTTQKHPGDMKEKVTFSTSKLWGRIVTLELPKRR